MIDKPTIKIIENKNAIKTKDQATKKTLNLNKLNCKK